MECLDNPVVTAFLKNEMYCDWCHAFNIGYNELWQPGEVAQLVPVPGPEHDPIYKHIHNDAWLVAPTCNPNVREAESEGALKLPGQAS